MKIANVVLECLAFHRMVTELIVEVESLVRVYKSLYMPLLKVQNFSPLGFVVLL